jgi:hypothetical protein
MNIGHDLLVAIGGTPGTWNLLWGGFFSCLGFLGGLAAVWRKLTCHEPRCARLAKHHVPGTAYVTCRKHHPTIPTKAVKGEITAAHDQAQRIASAVRRAATAPEPPVAATRRKRT